MADPPIDVNPLIWRRFHDKSLLIICARDAIKKRVLEALDEQCQQYKQLSARVIGVWELQNLIIQEALFYNILVVCGKSRVNSLYVKKLEELMSLFGWHLISPRSK